MLHHPAINVIQHAYDCFCSKACRIDSYNRIADDFTEDEMSHEYFRVIHRQEEEQLNRLFRKTKRKILFGYTFGKTALQGTIYTSFGAWISTQEQYRHMTTAERRNMANKIRYATKAFDDWDIIVHNLVNPAYKYVDARRFSVEHFYRARSPAWVNKQNNLLAPKQPVPRIIPNYDQTKVREILEFIKETSIIDDVSGDDEQLQLLSKDLLEGMRQLRDNDN